MLLCRDVVVRGVWQSIGQLAELVVVGREDRPATRRIVEVLRHGPGDREPIVRAGAPADLVEDHEGPVRSAS